MGENLRGLYWGGYVVLGAFLITGINYGVRYSFGIFVKPMALEYQWSRSVISAGMSTLLLMATFLILALKPAGSGSLKKLPI
jgi:hypothetical protein